MASDTSGMVDDDPVDSGAWEAVWEGSGEATAELIAAGLRDEGIDAVPKGNFAARFHSPMVINPSNWAVWVRSEDVDTALDYLEVTDLDQGAIYGAGDDDLPARLRTIAGLSILLVIAVLAVAVFANR